MKRFSKDDNVGPAIQLKHNVDAMGCLLMAVKRDLDQDKIKIDDLQEENRYLHRRCETISNIMLEQEMRVDVLEKLVSNLLQGPHHAIVEDEVEYLRSTRNYDMDFLDSLIADYETDDDLMDLLMGGGR